MERNYLLIQDQDGKTISFGEGTLKDWTARIGKPTQNKYTLKQITISVETNEATISEHVARKIYDYNLDIIEEKTISPPKSVLEFIVSETKEAEGK